MKKSKLNIIPLVLMGSTLAGCNATALAPNHNDVVTVTTETAANPIHDGQYEVYGTCTWSGYGTRPIIDRHNVNNFYRFYNIIFCVLDTAFIQERDLARYNSFSNSPQRSSL